MDRGWLTTPIDLSKLTYTSTTCIPQRTRDNLYTISERTKATYMIPAIIILTTIWKIVAHHSLLPYCPPLPTALLPTTPYCPPLPTALLPTTPYCPPLPTAHHSLLPTTPYCPPLPSARHSLLPTMHSLLPTTPFCHHSLLPTTPYRPPLPTAHHSLLPTTPFCPPLLMLLCNINFVISV